MSHHCDSVLVSCIDWRLHPYVEMSVHNLYGTADVIAVPGAAKVLVDKNSREHLFVDIQLSVDLHAPKTIILTSHRDCGAYGGSAAFGNDREREFSRHAEVLATAAEIVRARFPQLSVATLFFELDERDGRWVCTPTDLSTGRHTLDSAAPALESAEVA